MKIINLTPHDVVFGETPDDIKNKKCAVVPASGTVARAKTSREQINTFDIDGHSVPVNQTKFGEVENLPEPQKDTIYIVSAIVANAVPERSDLFIVDDAIRDESGRIIGARAIARV